MNQCLFLFFNNGENEQTAGMWAVFHATLTKLVGRAEGIPIKISDPTEAGLVKRFNLTGAPMPLVLVLAPNGAIFGSLLYGLMRIFQIPHTVSSPGVLNGANNFFELAVATAMILYSPESGVAQATVAGVLVVPVMLLVCSFCNRKRGWF